MARATPDINPYVMFDWYQPVYYYNPVTRKHLAVGLVARKVVWALTPVNVDKLKVQQWESDTQQISCLTQAITLFN